MLSRSTMLELHDTDGHSLASSTKEERQLRSNTVKPSSSSPHTRHCKTSHSSNVHKTVNAPRRGVKRLTTGPYSSASCAEQQLHTGPTKMASSVNYTKTGRISKAKKGLKVHICECGKSYTRAEHLRRHQRNHAQGGTLVCNFNNCGRSFFRADLLQRHQEKHDMSGVESPSSSVASRDETPEALQASEQTPEPSIIATSLPTTSHYHFSQTVSSVHNLVTVPRYTPNPFRTPQIPRTPNALSSGSNNVIRFSPVTSSPIHHKQQNLYPGRQSLSVYGSTEYMNHGVGWQSPGYSSSSGYASPNPGAGDYTNMFATPNYGSGSCRTRTSSNASFIEPWSFQSQSPMSCVSNIPHASASNNETTTTLSFPYMATSETLIDMSIPDDLDSLALYGPYGPRTMAMRDHEDEIVLFPEPHHGMNQITNIYPFENYLDSYWRLFHPAFPIIHRPTFWSMRPSPMLCAAMIAIGGHYSTDMNVKRKSRMLHERCIKLLERRHQNPVFGLERQCDYQAIFLIEVLSQYRSLRAPIALSSRFTTMYRKLAEDYRSTTSQISDVTPSLTQPESDTVNQWKKWVHLSTQQHLFLSCYLLEYQQAILLAREPQQCLIQESEFDLPIPAHCSIWESSNTAEWVAAAQQHSHIPKHVFESLSISGVISFDLFQSSILIAAHYNHFETSKPYLAPVLAMSFEELLDTSPITRHKLLTAKLLQVTPVRALLAVSGESWILTEKVNSAQDFFAFGSTLRTWITELWSSFAEESYTVSAREALSLSITILQQASVQGPDYLTPEMGADMGLYFAALVVWVATVTRTTIAMGSQCVVEQQHSLQPSLPVDPGMAVTVLSTQTPIFPYDPLLVSGPVQSAALGLSLIQDTESIQTSPFDTSPLSPHSQLNQTIISFLSIALQDLDCHPSPDTILRCQSGCITLLMWVKMRLCGAQGLQQPYFASGDEGCGELLNSIIASLERILSKGWEGWGI